DHPTGAWIIIAIHSTRLGPGTGGTRMQTYSDFNAALQDTLRLSESMTYKFAIPDMPYGGAKAVIAVPHTLDTPFRSELLKRYGKLIKQLGGLYLTGPDVGTSAEDMDIISETGNPYVFSRTPSAGGSGSSGPYTALGVFAAIQTACEFLFGSNSLHNRSVLVQGAGSVGRTLISHLQQAGAEIYFNDINTDIITRLENQGLHFIPSEQIYSTECDIFSPCALGGVLNAETIPQLNCRAIVGGANNQLTEPADADKLRDRNILYAPDYVVNIGGAMAILGLEVQGWTIKQAEAEVSANIKRALKQVLALSAKENITTEDAARRIAKKRLVDST
ncbi:MAG: leucine dehydrogenase, partial [candidate division Zixibacteria bacterium]|nr:leucine dehydrogenase [candidate division Zixibacteria bacterium]